MHAKVTLKTIPVDRIYPNPDQPRRHFDQAKLDELARSLRTRGQQQPIGVVYKPDSRLYMLISGERRWRAAQIAGLTELHAQVRHGGGDADLFVDALVENMARADMTPIEEAFGFHRMAHEGWTHDDIAAAVGKSHEYVRYRIDLLGLIQPAREALNKGHLQVGTAWYVSRLSPDGQTAMLRKLARGEFLTLRDAEAFAQALRDREANLQGDMFAVPDEPDEQTRVKVAANRRRVTSKIDQLSTAGAILADLSTMDVDDLAAALAGAPGGVEAWKQRIDHLLAAASKASARLRKAAAVAAASTVSINPELINS